jgi:hypothetical protein
MQGTHITGGVIMPAEPLTRALDTAVARVMQVTMATGIMGMVATGVVMVMITTVAVTDTIITVVVMAAVTVTIDNIIIEQIKRLPNLWPLHNVS